MGLGVFVGGQVFGAPLEEAIKRSPDGIPLVLSKCIEYLDRPGNEHPHFSLPCSAFSLLASSHS